MNGDGMELGFVAVWRKLMHTSFYKIPNTCHLAVHCLIRANHEPAKVFMNGSLHELKQGEFISGRKVLSKETGLTEREIRTSVDNLIKCDFLTIKPTNRFTLFSITNYAEYQAKLTNKLTNKRPTSDQQATTDNHYNTKEHIEQELITQNQEFEDFYKTYPKTQDKTTTYKIWCSRIKGLEDISNLKTAVKNYVSSQDDLQFIAYAHKFLIFWKDWVAPKPAMVNQKAKEQEEKERKAQESLERARASK